jgi:hypothetical protein
MGSRSEDAQHSRSPVDAEEDLIDRYENMVQTQVQTISDIDSKASRTLRVITLLLGAIFTAVSVSVTYFQNSTDSVSSLQILIFGTGIIFLLISLGYASVTYLSSVFEYGPSEKFGRHMAEYEVEAQDYRNRMLDAYADILDRNKRVVKNNARRFRLTMLCLQVSMLFFFTGGLSVVYTFDFGTNVVLFTLTWLGALALVQFINEEEYLTLDWQTSDHE